MMEQLHQIFGSAGGMIHSPTNSPLLDSSEQVYISSLVLLKMRKHGRAGVLMEVMGLMLGEFVDEYMVGLGFAMPQRGTGVSVEMMDHVFQTNMLDMLKQTGRLMTHFSVYLKYVSRESIHKLLKKYGPFREPVIRNYTRQILSGLSYFHGRNNIHRDIMGRTYL